MRTVCFTTYYVLYLVSVKHLNYNIYPPPHKHICPLIIIFIRSNQYFKDEWTFYPFQIPWISNCSGRAGHKSRFYLEQTVCMGCIVRPAVHKREKGVIGSFRTSCQLDEFVKCYMVGCPSDLAHLKQSYNNRLHWLAHLETFNYAHVHQKSAQLPEW